MRHLLLVTALMICCNLYAQRDTTRQNTNNYCDVITLKNGKLIYCKVQNIKHRSISYTGCGKTKDSVQTVATDSTFMINYVDGAVQSFGHLSGEDKRRPYIAIGGGMGIPTFSFGSPGPLPSSFAGELEAAHYDGYSDALIGACFNIMYAKQFTGSKIYFKGLLGYARNPLDIDAYTHVYGRSNASLPGSCAVPPFNGSTYEISITNTMVSGSYSATKLMAGVGFTKPGPTEISIDIFLGAASLTFPHNISYTASGPVGNGSNSSAVVTIYTSPGIGFAYQLGLSLRAFTIHKINLLASLDFFGAGANVPFSVQQTNFVPDVNVNHVGASKPNISYLLIEANLCVAYNFDK